MSRTWPVRVAPDGVSVELGAEGARCRDGGTAAGPCSAGNGTLELGTPPPLHLGAHTYTFEFGNAARERNVDLAPFRWILRSFKAR